MTRVIFLTNEEEILKELKTIRMLLEKLMYDKEYGGVNFDCLERIMYGAEQ